VIVLSGTVKMFFSLLLVLWEADSSSLFLTVFMDVESKGDSRSGVSEGHEGIPSVVYNTNNMILRNMRGSRYYHNMRLFVSYCCNIGGPYIIFPDDILPI
jgi:hypothetical protein